MIRTKNFLEFSVIVFASYVRMCEVDFVRSKYLFWQNIFQISYQDVGLEGERANVHTSHVSKSS
jgi:hypothetical protein